jgi:hypothetical protein
MGVWSGEAAEKLKKKEKKKKKKKKKKRLKTCGWDIEEGVERRLGN